MTTPPTPAHGDEPCTCTPGCKLLREDPRHGTPGGYGNGHCRCAPCKEANTAACARRRESRFRRGLSPTDPRHGTPGGYGNWGCHCPPCSTAWKADKDNRALRNQTGTNAEQVS